MRPELPYSVTPSESLQVKALTRILYTQGTMPTFRRLIPIAVSLCVFAAAWPAWSITVSAVGDIMLGTDYPSGAPLTDSDYFKAVRPLLQSADIRFGNYEGTLYDGAQNPDGKPGGPNRYIFRTPTPMVSHLKRAGFNVVSLANNHARDFGRIGLESTKRTFANAGIQYSSKDGEVATFNVNGQAVAVIAADFYPGRRSMVNPDSTYAEIRALKQRGAIVIVSVHAGGEGFGAEHVSNRTEIFLGENRGNSVKFAHEAIDAGADLMLMHGPHVPRGLEVYRNRLIAYSLGNFLTGRGINTSGNAGLAPLLEVELDNSGQFVQGKVTSFQQLRGGLSLDPQQRAFILVAQLSQLDFPSTMPKFSSQGYIYPANNNLR